MRVALAQMNAVVGDVEANAGRAVEAIREAGRAGARLVVLPEMFLVGYPPRDLLARDALAARAESSLQEIAAATRGGPAALVGYPEKNTAPGERPYHNTTALLDGGEVLARYRKRLLPSYDVFDEDRWFEPGDSPGILAMGSVRLGVLVCEDIWNTRALGARPLYRVDPVADLVRASVDVILNPSASPFWTGKPGMRERMLAGVARDSHAPILFVNQVGGNDELVFDGGSLAVGADGATGARAPLFEEALLVVEVGPDGSVRGDAAVWPAQGEEVVARALGLGIRDYVRKCGFADVVLGLSGGIDSALVAILASGALGPEHVTALAMPSRFSSRGSLEDARALAAHLGIRLVEVSIEPAFQALVDTLEPHFRGREPDTAEENLQARVRGTLLMAFSNKFGGLVLATGNKSELAVGYCTLHGDMVGALAPIGDVLKTDVYAIARHLDGGRGIVPRAIFEKAPSAELRSDQTDQDTLPPYDVLDRVLRSALEEDADVEAIVADGIDRRTVGRILEMVRRAEHKRSQAAPVIKVSRRAFGPGRRYPIAQGFRQ